MVPAFCFNTSAYSLQYSMWLMNYVTLMKKQACLEYTDLQNSRTLARYCAKFLIMNTSKMFPRLRKLCISTTSNNNQSHAELALADYYYNTFLPVMYSL